MIAAIHNAEKGVRNGNILIHQGRINPNAPKISEMPIKRIRGIGNPSTPVWPMATSFCAEKIDLFTPEYKKTSAINDCNIQSAVFITLIVLLSKGRDIVFRSF